MQKGGVAPEDESALLGLNRTAKDIAHAGNKGRRAGADLIEKEGGRACDRDEKRTTRREHLSTRKRHRSGTSGVVDTAAVQEDLAKESIVTIEIERAAVDDESIRPRDGIRAGQRENAIVDGDRSAEGRPVHHPAGRG